MPLFSQHRDRTIPLIPKSKSSSHSLDCVGLGLKPCEDRFSHDAAHFIEVRKVYLHYRDNSGSEYHGRKSAIQPKLMRKYKFPVRNFAKSFANFTFLCENFSSQ